MVLGYEVFQTPNPDNGILNAVIHCRDDFHCTHQESSHIFTFWVAAPLMNFPPRMCCGFYAEFGFTVADLRGCQTSDDRLFVAGSLQFPCSKHAASPSAILDSTMWRRNHHQHTEAQPNTQSGKVILWSDEMGFLKKRWLNRKKKQPHPDENQACVRTFRTFNLWISW